MALLGNIFRICLVIVAALELMNTYKVATRQVKLSDALIPFGGSKIPDINTALFERFANVLSIIGASSKLFLATAYHDTSFLLFNAVLHLVLLFIFGQFAIQSKTWIVPSDVMSGWDMKSVQTFFQSLIANPTPEFVIPNVLTLALPLIFLVAAVFSVFHNIGQHSQSARVDQNKKNK